MKISLTSPDRQSRLTILSQNGTATAIHVRDLPVTGLQPEMRLAERAKHVLALKGTGRGGGLAAFVRRLTNAIGQERRAGLCDRS
jgi:hypothetical protein